MHEPNPYAPPRDDFPPPPMGDQSAGFLANGRGVPIGNGARWISEGWELFKRSPWIWIAIFVIQIVIQIPLSLLLSLIPHVGRFLAGAVSPLFSAGLMLGCRELAEGRTLEVGTLFAGFQRHAGRLLALGLLHVAGSFAVALLAIQISGPVLESVLIRGKVDRFTPDMLGPMMSGLGVYVALTIPITMATYFAPALIALNDLGPFAAIRSSLLGAVKNIGPFIVYSLLAGVLAIAAVIPCGLGVFVLVPTLIAAMYCTYRDVFYTSEIG
jgi:hypothetical protein